MFASAAAHDSGRSRGGTGYQSGGLAFAVYSVLLLIMVLPGLFGGSQLLNQLLGSILGLSTQAMALAGLAGTTLLAGGFGWVGLRFAEKKIDNYTATP